MFGGWLNMSAEKKLSNFFAEESDKTKKLREKLTKQLASIDEKITQQALNRKIHEIHYWISRHAVNRVPLKSKSISLFDENQNTAKVSQKIVTFVEKINFQIESLEVQSLGKIEILNES